MFDKQRILLATGPRDLNSCEWSAPVAVTAIAAMVDLVILNSVCCFYGGVNGCKRVEQASIRATNCFRSLLAFGLSSSLVA